MTHWKRPWGWERLKTGEEGDNRGLDGWMASLTQWTWIWGNYRREWRAEDPGVLQSMGSLRVGHDWATSLSLFTFMHWKRKGQPIPVFLPGESQGRGILVDCHLWGRTESDTTEVTQQVLSVVFNRPCKMLMSFFIFCLHYGRCWRWATGESETQAWATSAPATNSTLRNIEKPAKIS